MPCLVAIGKQIKEKHRGVTIPPAYILPKEPSLNRVNSLVNLWDFYSQRVSFLFKFYKKWANRQCFKSLCQICYFFFGRRIQLQSTALHLACSLI